MELILREDVGRWLVYPIQYPKLFDMYKKALASFWTVEEVDVTRDKTDFQAMTANEQHFIKHVLAFFASSDGIVMENLAAKFCQEVQICEARLFYGTQINMEGIHAEMYALLLETLVTDSDEKVRLQRAVTTMPCVRDKANWALRWITSSTSFATRLLAFALVEGVFFSGSFCAIFWLKKQGKMPGLTFSNEKISGDEGLHVDFAALLYTMLQHTFLDVDAAHQIVDEAVQIEKRFICDALPVSLIGMNATLMSHYIEYVADRLLCQLGYVKLYHATNPFEWMEAISLQGKTNFFEKRVAEYQRAGVVTAEFTTEAEF